LKRTWETLNTIGEKKGRECRKFRKQRVSPSKIQYKVGGALGLGGEENAKKGK